MKRRLDVLLVERGLADSREKAQRLIMAGEVFVADQRVGSASKLVDADANIVVRVALPYVSRGGYKLAAALDSFKIDVTGNVCADIGASTGGFTDVLLQRGAAQVYAIDVGYGQLDWKLRSDPRVVVMERMNIRAVASLPEPIAFACVDVSFISLKLVLPVVRRLLDGGRTTDDGETDGRRTTDDGGGRNIIGHPSSIVALIKPQFETGREQVGKGGVVRDAAVHRAVLTDMLDYCANNDWGVRGLIVSPIKGPAGNIEFLVHLTSSPSVVTTSPSSLIEAALSAAEKL